MDSIPKTRFDRADWVRLFLICSFPIHFWAFLSAFKDFTWLLGQIGLWDGIGFLSYVLIYSLIDTFLLFLLVAAVKFLTPKSWKKEYRFTWLVWLGFSIALLSLIDQLFVYDMYIQWVDGIFNWLKFPVWSLLVFGLGVILLSVFLPQLTFKNNHKFLDKIYSLLDKFLQYH